MKLIKSILILTFSLGLTMTSHSENIFPYEIKQYSLNNGLNLVVIPYNSPGVVAYYTIVRTGSRNEVEPGKTGFAHFFEHMMFRGTEKYSDVEYNRVLKLLGADSNAFTSLDLTAYHIVASADALETIIDIESDRFQNLKYSKEQFQTEAGAILGEYNKSAMNPFQILNEEMSKLAFNSHTYRHTTIGYLEDIKEMPNQYEYSLQFFDRYYRPEYCTVVIVGDVNFDKAKSLVDKYYGNWKRGSFIPNIPKEPEQKAERTLDAKAPHKTLPYLYVGYKVPEFNDLSKDIAALNVISRLLFAETSELYQKLVLDEKLVDFVSGSAPLNRDPSLFRIYGRIKKEGDIDKVKNSIYNAIDELKSNPVSPKKLNDVISNLKYSFIHGLDNPDDVASTVSYYVNLTNDPISLNRFYSTISNITPDDIQAAAKKYFGSESRNVVLLTSGGN
ncbi:MAG: insulinase family protein [Ignavibacteria bacterium]|nr:insulinase family protein [Ignavibacteria bacterium]